MILLVKTWFSGYFRPSKMVSDLGNQQSPLLGLWATLLRGLMNSFLLYLPLVLLGRKPSMPSFLPFVRTQDYFLFLTVIAPLFFILQWLYLSGSIYLILRILRRECSFHHILNTFGLVSLVVGSVLILWDWPWIILQSKNYVLLGMSHIAVDVWAIALAAVCLRTILGIGMRLAVLLSIAWVALSLPPAMLIMRSPL